MYFILVCKISEWSQCYESQGECLKNRTVCSDVGYTNCTSEWSEWTDWTTCSFNLTGDCVQTRKKTAECGEEMTDTAECQPQLCNSSKYCINSYYDSSYITGQYVKYFYFFYFYVAFLSFIFAFWPENKKL